MKRSSGQTSQISLDAVWDSTEDDVYAQLLENDIILDRYPFRICPDDEPTSCCGNYAAPQIFYHSTNEQNYIVT